MKIKVHSERTSRGVAFEKAQSKRRLSYCSHGFTVTQLKGQGKRHDDSEHLFLASEILSHGPASQSFTAPRGDVNAIKPNTRSDLFM
jgi:hypothetical protein